MIPDNELTKIYEEFLRNPEDWHKNPHHPVHKHEVEIFMRAARDVLSLREQKRKLVTVASETAEVITKLKKHLGKEGEYSFCSKHGDKLTFTDALIIGQICEDGDSATDKYESLMKELDA